MTSVRDESTVGPEVVLGTQAGLRKGIGHLSAQQHKGGKPRGGAGAGARPFDLTALHLGIPQLFPRAGISSWSIASPNPHTVLCSWGPWI